MRWLARYFKTNQVKEVDSLESAISFVMMCHSAYLTEKFAKLDLADHLMYQMDQPDHFDVFTKEWDFLTCEDEKYWYLVAHPYEAKTVKLGHIIVSEYGEPPLGVERDGIQEK